MRPAVWHRRHGRPRRGAAHRGLRLRAGPMAAHGHRRVVRPRCFRRPALPDVRHLVPATERQERSAGGVRGVQDAGVRRAHPAHGAPGQDSQQELSAPGRAAHEHSPPRGLRHGPERAQDQRRAGDIPDKRWVGRVLGTIARRVAWKHVQLRHLRRGPGAYRRAGRGAHVHHRRVSDGVQAAGLPWNPARPDVSRRGVRANPQGRS